MVSLSSLLAAAVLSFLVLSFFTAEGFESIDYKDLATLRGSLTENGKIVPSRISGTKPHFQRPRHLGKFFASKMRSRDPHDRIRLDESVKMK